MAEDQTFGPYVLQAELGRGAMGVVYSAVQSTLERPVALKVMRPEFAQDQDYRERFAREASSLARLDSPHVIHIYDFGEFESQLYIAYQLVSGGNLEARINAQAGLQLAETLELTIQICSALRDAHDVKVVHRDVKPSNVLLRPGSDPFAYLCDFGIARSLDAEATTTQGVIGTVAYMAPERFDGVPASPSTDLYSLGCLMYAMLSGRTPYAGTSTQVMLKHVQAPIPSIRSGSAADATVNQILQRSMFKDPAYRYPDAAAMIHDLNQARMALASSDYRVFPAMDLSDTIDTPAVEGTVYRPHSLVAGPAPSPAPPAPAPVASTEKRSRKGMLLGLAGAAALVLVGVGFGLVKILGGTESGATSATDTSQVTSSAAATPSAEPSAEPSSEAEQESDPEPAASPESQPTVTCWDASTAATLAACGAPTGQTGLEWVFPSLESTPGCARVIDPGGRKQGKRYVVECVFAASGGGGITMRFAEWYRVSKALEHYRDKDGGSGVRREVLVAGKPARDVWNYGFINNIGQYSGASVYREHPFTVSVESDDSAALTDALTSQIKFRKPSELRGLPN